MEFKKTQKVVLPDIDISEEDIENPVLVEPVDFLSEEDNAHILEVLKQGLRDLKNPDKWMTWEDLNNNIQELIKSETI